MKKHIALILLILTSFTSCDKFLDQQSKTQVDGQEMFGSEQGFKDALTACYVMMKSDVLYGSYLSMTTTELMAQLWDPDPLNMQGQIDIKSLDFTTTASRNMFSGIYGSMYNVVAQANDVLANLGKSGDRISSDATREVIRAEALAIRAFIHMDVLRLFGQMPAGGTTRVQLAYAEQITKDEIPFYDFDTYAEMLFRDLNAAEEIFQKYDPLADNTFLGMDSSDAASDDFLTYRRFRMNLYAVKALKARLSLYLGNTADAYKFAKEVIDAKTTAGESVITLSGDTDLGSNYYAMPTECIFAISKTDISDAISSISSWRLTKAHYEDLFGRNLSTDSRAQIVWDRTATNASNTNLPTLRKYKKPGADEFLQPTTLATRRQLVPMIRIPEMYLIAIETTTSLTEANALYKEFMLARRIVIDTDLTRDELDAEVENEYRRELYAEGQMFYYYKRKGAKTMLWGMGSNLTENNYIVPLPETELRVNQ